MRSVLIDIIERADALTLVGVAADAQQAIELARRQQPDVALLDVKMPGGGPRAAREIRASSPKTAIIALSAHEDARSVQEMLAQGRTTTSPRERVPMTSSKPSVRAWKVRFDSRRGPRPSSSASSRPRSRPSARWTDSASRGTSRSTGSSRVADWSACFSRSWRWTPERQWV